MKRIIALILASLMILSVAASCKKGGGGGGDDKPSFTRPSTSSKPNSSSSSVSYTPEVNDKPVVDEELEATLRANSGVYFLDNSDVEAEYNRNLFFYNELKFEVADPTVIYVDAEKTFYAYGTSDQIGCHGFQAWKSSDLANWEDLGPVYLPDFLNSWTYTNYWAPEIIYDEVGMLLPVEGGVEKQCHYFMFYNAEIYDESLDYVGNSTAPQEPLKYMSVLYAEHPAGPFYHPDGITNKDGKALSVSEPVFDFSYENSAIDKKLRCDNTIDASPFIDSNGDLYMYYSGWDYKEYGNWNDATIGSGVSTPKQQSIYGVKMKDWFTPDYSTVAMVAEVRHKTVGGEKMDDTWGEDEDNIWGVNEGPFMYKSDNGTYMLTFSIHHFSEKGYQVRLATSDSPLSGFTKIDPDDGGTVIATSDKWNQFAQSAGHHVFIEVGDELYIAYHTFKNRLDISEGRALAIDKVQIIENSDGKEVFHTNGPSYSHQALPSKLSGYKNVAGEASVSGDITSNKAGLTDGLVKYHPEGKVDDVQEVGLKKNAEVTFNFSGYKNVRAILVHLSQDKDKLYECISKITLTYKSTSGDKTVDISTNNGLYWDLDSYCTVSSRGQILKVNPGATHLIEFAELPVKKVEIEFYSADKEFNLNEIQILANAENTTVTAVSDTKLKEKYKFVNADVPVSIKRNQSENGLMGSVRVQDNKGNSKELHTTFGVDLTHDDGTKDAYIQTMGPREQYAFLKGVATDTIYFEAEVGVYEEAPYLADQFPKLGLVAKSANGCTFFYIDACDADPDNRDSDKEKLDVSTIYTNRVVGYVQSNIGGDTWDWTNTEAKNYTPSIRYNKGTNFVKLAIARVGGNFYFYCDDLLLFSSTYLRNLTAGVDAGYGFLCFNTGMMVKNVSYTVNEAEVEAKIAERDTANKNFNPVVYQEIDDTKDPAVVTNTTTAWNLTQDYVSTDANYADRKVTLSKTDSTDNFLFFNGTKATTLYAEATFKVVGGTLEGMRWNENTKVYDPLYEPYGKFGLMLRDSNDKGIYFYPNAATDVGSRVSTVDEMKANDVKFATTEQNSDGAVVYSWDKACAIEKFDATKPITLGIYRQGELFKLLVDGEVVFVTTLGVTEEIYPALFSFHVGLEVTDYRVTDDLNDEMIKKLYEDTSTSKFGENKPIDSWGSWKTFGNTAVNYGANGLEATAFTSIEGTDLYFEATLNLHSVNNDDLWSKVGLTFRSDSLESYYYIDAINGATIDDKLIPFGHNNVVGVNHSMAHNTYTTLATVEGLDYNKVTLGILYTDGYIYYVVNGKVVATENGIAGHGANDSICVGLMTTNVNFAAYDVWGTTNATELAQIKTNLNIA